MTMPSAPDAGLPAPQRYWAIAALSLGTGALVIDSSIAMVALPRIAEDLGIEQSASVSVVTIYQIVLLATILPFSSLGDRIGHKKVYVGGQILFVAMSAATLMVRDFGLLLVLRALQALGAAATLSLMSAMMRNTYPSAQLGRGMALNSIILSVSAALAPTLGGFIAGHFSWPIVFFCAAPFICLSLVLSGNLPNLPPVSVSFDVVGGALCVLSFGALIAGLELLVHGADPAFGYGVAATGLAGSVLFVWRERRMTHPIFPVDLFRDSTFKITSVSSVSAFTASMLLMVIFPFQLHDQYAMPVAQIGLVMAAWPAMMMVVSPLAGLASDKLPDGLSGSLGMLIVMATALSLYDLPESPSAAELAFRWGLFGVGFGLFLTPNARSMVNTAPRHRIAAAGASISVSRLSGQTLGASLGALALASEVNLDEALPGIVAAISSLICVANILLWRMSKAD